MLGTTCVSWTGRLCLGHVVAPSWNGEFGVSQGTETSLFWGCRFWGTFFFPWVGEGWGFPWRHYWSWGGVGTWKFSEMVWELRSRMCRVGGMWKPGLVKRWWGPGFGKWQVLLMGCGQPGLRCFGSGHQNQQIWHLEGITDRAAFNLLLIFSACPSQQTIDTGSCWATRNWWWNGHCSKWGVSWFWSRACWMTWRTCSTMIARRLFHIIGTAAACPPLGPQAPAHVPAPQMLPSLILQAPPLFSHQETCIHDAQMLDCSTCILHKWTTCKSISIT